MVQLFTIVQVGGGATRTLAVTNWVSVTTTAVPPCSPFARSSAVSRRARRTASRAPFGRFIWVSDSCSLNPLRSRQLV